MQEMITIKEKHWSIASRIGHCLAISTEEQNTIPLLWIGYIYFKEEIWVKKQL